MSEKRTEDQVLMSEPLTMKVFCQPPPEPLRVSLGGESYEIPIRRIREAHDWRRKVGVLCGRFAKVIFSSSKYPDGDFEVDLGEAFSAVLPVVLGEGFEDLIECFFLYAPDLPRAEIEAKATDEEMIDAALEVFKIGFPFVLRMSKAALAMVAAGQPGNPAAA